MANFPRDASKQRVVKALESLGFRLVREQQHISPARYGTGFLRHFKRTDRQRGRGSQVTPVRRLVPDEH
jgi:hypothetical protein